MADNKKNQVKTNVNKLNSQWLKNTLRSLGVAGTDALKDVMPATGETISNVSSMVTSAITKQKSEKSYLKRFQDAVTSNEAFKFGKEFFGNAVEDIKSGNIYNTEREPDFGFSDDDFSFDDIEEDSFDFSFADEINQQSVMNTAATVKTIQQNTEFQVKAAKATVDTMATLSTTHLMKINELGNQIVGELSNINTNLAGILEYNNTNMTKFIEASIGYYEQMTTPKEEERVKEKIDPESLIGSSGGLDIQRYKEYVLNNIKSMSGEGMMGMLSMVLENKDMLTSNPLGMVLTAGMKKLIPEYTKRVMAEFDKSFEDFIPTMLERIGEWADTEEEGTVGVLKKYIGKAFGTRERRKKGFNFSKIEKGPVPYNGMANHTIVEIIPKYLRESNTYLREIAEAVTGKSNEQMSKGFTGFDWETGQFKSIDQLQANFNDNLQSIVTSAMSFSEFGDKLSESRKFLTNDKDLEKYDDALEQLYTRIEQQKGQIDYSNKEVVHNLVEGIYSSDSIKNLIESTIEHLQETSSEAIGSAHVAKMKATREKNRAIDNINRESGKNGIHQIADKGNYDEYIDRKYKREADASLNENGHETSSANVSVIGLLEGIQRTLDRGIYVEIKKGLNIPQPVTVESTNSDNNENTQNDIQQQVENTTKEYFKAMLETEHIEEERDAEIDNDETRAPIRTAQEMVSTTTKVMNAIMARNSDQAWDAFISGTVDKMKAAGSWVSENFLSPIKDALFGKKDEDGYLKGGMFEGMNNRLKESVFQFRHMMTGKGYTKADGTVVDDANEEEMQNTVVGKMKKVANTIKDGISVKLFGKKDEDGEVELDENGKPVKGGLMGSFSGGIKKAASSLTKGLYNWKVALFGEDEEGTEEEKVEKFGENVKEKFLDFLPTAITGTMLGGGIGAIAGLGTAGTLMETVALGPIGAIAGLTIGIATKSDKFKNWLFGEKDDDGERTGGIISKNMQEYFKKNGLYLAGGATLGLLKGVFMPGGGWLTGLVGGPLAGVVTGVATSMVMKSDIFQKFLFGDEKAGYKGLVGNIKSLFGKFGEVTGNKGGKLAGMAAISGLAGAALGKITVSTLASQGIIGASLGIAGPIGGALLGLGAAIIAQKDNFKTWFFGETDPETGEKREGLLGKFKNMLAVNVFEPMKNSMKSFGRDAKTFLYYDVLQRFNLVLEPITGFIGNTFHKVMGGLSSSFKSLGGYLRDSFADKIVDKTEAIIEPIRKTIGLGAKAIWKASKLVISSPLKLAYMLTSPILSTVGKAVGGVVKGAFGLVNTLVVKPIGLVMKPLVGAIGLATKVISAPFKLIANVTDKVNDFLHRKLDQLAIFANTMKNTMINFGKKVLLDNPITNFFKKGGQKVLDTVDRIKSTVKIVFSPLTDLVKACVIEVKDGILGGLRKIGSVILSPLKKLFGIGKRKKDPTEMGFIRRAWYQAGQGITRDVDGELTAAQRRKQHKFNRKHGRSRDYYEDEKDGSYYIQDKNNENLFFKRDKHGNDLGVFDKNKVELQYTEWMDKNSGETYRMSSKGDSIEKFVEGKKVETISLEDWDKMHRGRKYDTFGKAYYTLNDDGKTYSKFDAVTNELVDNKVKLSKNDLAKMGGTDAFEKRSLLKKKNTGVDGYEENRQKDRLDKHREENMKLIYKWTGRQRKDDTQENRDLAIKMAQAKGKKITFHDIETVDAKEKREAYIREQQVADDTANIKDNTAATSETLSQLANDIRVALFGTNEDKEKARDMYTEHLAQFLTKNTAKDRNEMYERIAQSAATFAEAEKKGNKKDKDYAAENFRKDLQEKYAANKAKIVKGPFKSLRKAWYNIKDYKYGVDVALNEHARITAEEKEAREEEGRKQKREKSVAATIKRKDKKRLKSLKERYSYLLDEEERTLDKNGNSTFDDEKKAELKQLYEEINELEIGPDWRLRVQTEEDLAERIRRENEKEDEKYQEATVYQSHDLEARFVGIRKYGDGRIVKEYRVTNPENNVNVLMTEDEIKKRDDVKIVADGDVSGYASGTKSAKSGISQVGEEGAEILFPNGLTQGKIVGINGTEIVNMNGGEEVVSNSNIPEGVKDIADGYSKQTDQSLLNNRNSTKLSVSERILQQLLKFSSYAEKVSNPDDEYDDDDDLSTSNIDKVKSGFKRGLLTILNMIPGGGIIKGIINTAKAAKTLLGAGKEVVQMGFSKVKKFGKKIVNKGKRVGRKAIGVAGKGAGLVAGLYGISKGLIPYSEQETSDEKDKKRLQEFKERLDRPGKLVDSYETHMRNNEKDKKRLQEIKEKYGIADDENKIDYTDEQSQAEDAKEQAEVSGLTSEDAKELKYDIEENTDATVNDGNEIDYTDEQSQAEDAQEQEEVTQLTSEKAKEEAALKKEDDEDDATQEGILATLQGLKKGQDDGEEVEKEKSSFWSSLFSKKGLITSSLLALSPMIIKGIHWLTTSETGQAIISTISSVGGAIFNILEGIGSIVGSIFSSVAGFAGDMFGWLADHFIDDFKFGQSALGNGDTSAEKAQDIENKTEKAGEDLKDGDIFEAISHLALDEHGNADQTTMPIIKFITKSTANTIAKVFGGGSKSIGSKVLKKIGSSVNKISTKIWNNNKLWNTEVIDDVVEESMEATVKEGGEAAAEQGARKAAGEAAEQGAEATVKEGGEAAAERGARKAAGEAAEQGAEATVKEGGEAAAERGARKAAGEAAEQGAEATVKEGGEAAAERGARKVAGEVVEEGGEAVTDAVIKNSDEVIDVVTDIGGRSFKPTTITTRLNAGNTTEVIMEAADEKGIFKTIKEMFENIIDKIKKNFKSNLGDEAVEAGAGVIGKVVKAFDGIKIGTTIFKKLVGKLCAIIGKSVALAFTVIGLLASEVFGAVLGFVDGLTAAPKLFGVENPDWAMVGISGVMGAFTGTTIGAVFDVIASIIAAVSGLDIKSELCWSFYYAMMKVTGNEEKYKKMEDERLAARDKYEVYRNEEMAKEYEAQRALGVFDDTVTFEDYKEGVIIGDYQATYKSFQNWFADNHKSLGDYESDFIEWVAKPIFADNYTYVDSIGNKYKKLDNGQYSVTLANGQKGGNVSGEILCLDEQGNLLGPIEILYRTDKNGKKEHGQLILKDGEVTWKESDTAIESQLTDEERTGLAAYQGDVNAENATLEVGSDAFGEYQTNTDGEKEYYGDPDDAYIKMSAEHDDTKYYWSKETNSWRSLGKDGNGYYAIDKNGHKYYNYDYNGVTWSFNDDVESDDSNLVIDKVQKDVFDALVADGEDPLSLQRNGDGALVVAASRYEGNTNTNTGKLLDYYRKDVGFDLIEYLKADQKDRDFMSGKFTVTEATVVPSSFYNPKEYDEYMKHGYISDKDQEKLDSEKWLLELEMSGKQHINGETYHSMTNKYFKTDKNILVDVHHKNELGGYNYYYYDKNGQPVKYYESTLYEEQHARTYVDTQCSEFKPLMKFVDYGYLYALLENGRDIVYDETENMYIDLDLDGAMEMYDEYYENIFDENYMKKFASAYLTANGIDLYKGTEHEYEDSDIHDIAWIICRVYYVGRGDCPWDANTVVIHHSINDYVALLNKNSIKTKRTYGKYKNTFYNNINGLLDKEMLHNIKPNTNSINSAWDAKVAEEKKKQEKAAKAKESATPVVNSAWDAKLLEEKKQDEKMVESSKNIKTDPNSINSPHDVKMMEEEKARQKELEELESFEVNSAHDAEILKKRWANYRSKYTDKAIEEGDIEKGGLASLVADKKEAITGFHHPDSGEAWFDVDGSYYVLEGETYTQYSQMGDVIRKNVPVNTIEIMVKQGLLKIGTINTKLHDLGQTTVNNMQELVNQYWTKFKGESEEALSAVKINSPSDLKHYNSKKFFSTTFAYISAIGEAMKTANPNTTNNTTSGGSGTGIVQGGRGEINASYHPSILNGSTYFSQSDSRWANTEFQRSDGIDDGATINDTGCGPTAMSMVVSDMTNHKTNPVEMSKLAQITGDRDDTGTNWNFIDTAANTYGLNSMRASFPSSSYISEGLNSGTPMVLSGQNYGNSNSPYTSSGHYVVAVGKDSSGNVIINDPRGAQYSKHVNPNDLARETNMAWSFSNPNTVQTVLQNGISFRNGLPTKSKKGGRGGVTAQDVVNVAKNEIGTLQDSVENSTSEPNKYSRELFASGGHWCAAFVSWCVWTAANKDKTKAKELMCGSLSSSTNTIMNNFKSKNQFSSTPQIGSFIIFNWAGSDALADHIGIVESFDNTNVYTIEGNSTNPNGGADGVFTHQYLINDSQIVGYCHPKYDGSSDFNGIFGDATVDNSSMTVLDKLGSYMSGIGSSLFNAVLTGNYDIDWKSVLAQSLGSSTGTTNGVASNAVVTGTVIKVPRDVQTGITENYTNYDYWYPKWASSSTQRTIADDWDSKGRAQDKGIAMLDGNYLLAMTPKFGTTGDIVQVKLEDGETFNAILGDSKGADASSEWGHTFGDSGKSDIIEWEACVGSDSAVGRGHDGISLEGNWKGKYIDTVTNGGPYYEWLKNNGGTSTNTNSSTSNSSTGTDRLYRGMESMTGHALFRDAKGFYSYEGTTNGTPTKKYLKYNESTGLSTDKGYSILSNGSTGLFYRDNRGEHSITDSISVMCKQKMDNGKNIWVDKDGTYWIDNNGNKIRPSYGGSGNGPRKSHINYSPETAGTKYMRDTIVPDNSSPTIHNSKYHIAKPIKTGGKGGDTSFSVGKRSLTQNGVTPSQKIVNQMNANNIGSGNVEGLLMEVISLLGNISSNSSNLSLLEDIRTGIQTTSGGNTFNTTNVMSNTNNNLNNVSKQNQKQRVGISKNEQTARRIALGH